MTLHDTADLNKGLLDGFEASTAREIYMVAAAKYGRGESSREKEVDRLVDRRDDSTRYDC